MKIIFKQITDEEVLIIDSETGNQVGNIFTPAGTTHNVTNAIQICGCAEFYDAWGCANYAIPIKDNIKDMICSSLENKQIGMKQAKDIQIMFSSNAMPSSLSSIGCEGCFNRPCTCENQGNHKHLSPYNVKRADDLPLEFVPGKEDIKIDDIYPEENKK